MTSYVKIWQVMWKSHKLCQYLTSYVKIWQVMLKSDKLCQNLTSYVKIWEVMLKSDKNNGTLNEDLCPFMIISFWILLRMKNFQKNFAEKIKTWNLISSTFFRNSPSLWDNVKKKIRKAGRTTDDNVEHAHCMLNTKAKNTHSEYVMIIAFARQKWLRERASMLCSEISWNDGATSWSTTVGAATLNSRRANNLMRKLTRISFVM